MRLLGSLVIFAAAFAVYGRTVNYEMMCDDFPSIIQNNSIRQLFPLFGPPGEPGPLDPRSDAPVSARPAVNLTFAINYQFSQDDPYGYRVTHIVTHAIVALILWGIISITLRQPVFQGRFDHSSQMLGFVSAVIWLMHPMHAETLVYLTQRTELQMGLFYALTILLSICYWQSGSWLGKSFYCVAAFITSVCGMLSKEMMASVPAMVFFYEWTFSGVSLKPQIKRSWPLYMALILSWIPICALYMTRDGTPAAGFNNIISAHDYWLTLANAFFLYWRMTFIPWPMLVHYHVDTLSTLSQAWPGVLGLGLYLIACTYFVWRRSSLGYMLLWFFAVLSPTLIVPLPHEEISERRLYVTLMATVPFFVVVGYLTIKYVTGKLTERTKEQRSEQAPGRGALVFKILCASLCFGVVGAYYAAAAASLPRFQLRSYVWDHVLEYQPHNTFALCAQGVEDCNRGEDAVGLAKIQAAYDTDPTYRFFSLSLAGTLKNSGDYQRLLALSRKQHEMFPEKTSWTLLLALALEKNGMNPEAITKYREVIAATPNDWQPHSALATLLAENGKVDESIKHFEIATKLHPDFMNCMNLMDCI